MVEIFLYAFGIMYTPGPCNLLSLNSGLNGQISSALRFCMGITVAMLLMFVTLGYTGAWLITPAYQLLIGGVGSLYIAYLACKLALGAIQQNTPEESLQPLKAKSQLNFRTGMIMQMLNPKSFVAILPIVTVQFPAAGIGGASILFWSVMLSCLAFGAPSSYLLLGTRLSRLVSSPTWLSGLNLMMALLLFYVAGDIAYNHVFLMWR